MPASLAIGSADSVWSDAEASFYHEGLQQSDYALRMGAVLADLLGSVDSLLDVGAGAGTLPATFLSPSARWTALEPNEYLVSCLNCLGQQQGFRLQVIKALWQQIEALELPRHQGVLAANMGGPLTDPLTFWQTLAPLCSQRMVWTVPAQRGPRQACLSGALPAELHGEDETPAVESVLAALPENLQPDEVHWVDWTFSYRFDDFSAAEQYFQQRFNPQGGPARAYALRSHLEQTLEDSDNGVLVHAPKRGACLVWNFTQEGAV